MLHISLSQDVSLGPRQKGRTMAQERLDALNDLYSFYGQEALRCENASAWLAGCAMRGAQLEAKLRVLCEMSGVSGRSWTLGPLSEVAVEEGWLPAKIEIDGDQVPVSELTKFVMEMRNLLHAGNVLAEDMARWVDETTFRVQSKFLAKLVIQLDGAEKVLS